MFANAPKKKKRLIEHTPWLRVATSYKEWSITGASVRMFLATTNKNSNWSCYTLQSRFQNLTNVLKQTSWEIKKVEGTMESPFFILAIFCKWTGA
jgi:hypothetical protein